MRYKIHHEPFYDFESFSILRAIYNKRSIKEEATKATEKLGGRYKSVVAEFFSNSIALEKYVKKTLNLNDELAAFLFKEQGDDKYCLAEACFCRTRMLEYDIDNIGAAILDTIDGDYWTKNPEAKIPPIITDGEFFKLVDECKLTSEEKMAALQMYHNFDMYFTHFKTLLTHVTSLVIEKMPAFKPSIESFMGKLSNELDTKGKAFFTENFNITISESDTSTEIFDIYPGIYTVSSVHVWGLGYAGPFIAFGFGVLEAKKIYSKEKSGGEKAEQFLKLLSDNTKLSILKLLKDGPMYSSQLAEKLNCTSANISYHMSQLLTLDVLTVEKENNRIYLHLNKDGICNLLDDAKGLFR